MTVIERTDRLAHLPTLSLQQIVHMTLTEGHCIVVTTTECCCIVVTLKFAAW